MTGNSVMMRPMRSGKVQGQEPAGASMLDEIRRTAEHRLQEIEPLIEEAEGLRNVLSAIEHEPQPHARAADLNNGHADAADSTRAAKGANKRMILELIAQRPGITTAEIAEVSGIKRTVVASTVSRLKRHGELQEHERGVRVASPL
jgi:predicted transcriptional regulator